MPRIAQADLDRIKSEVDLTALVRSSGVELKKQGKDLVGLCPFHNDTTPSLLITPKKNLWNCLGACGTGGGPIDWVMKSQGVGFKHAVEVLKDDKNTTLINAKIITRSTVPKLPSPVESTVDDQKLMSQVINYYHETLKKTPSVLKYLQKRGLIHPELINRFKLGFADRSLGIRLPHKNRTEGAKIRSRLADLGIYRESGHEHFNGSLVVPIFNKKKQITEIYGRKTGDKLRKGTAFHLYLPGEHQGIFNPEALQSKDIILCESIIDAMSFWVNDFRNVTTSYGINGFTEELKISLSVSPIKKVYLAYDADEAGEKAAFEHAKHLYSKGFDCFRVRFPVGEDANSFILKFDKPEDKHEALKKLINAAECMEFHSLPIENGTLQPTASKDEAKTFIPIAANTVNLDNTKELNVITVPVQKENPNTTKSDQEIPFNIKEDEIFFNPGDRQWRVRGLKKNLSFEVMKINLRVTYKDKFHIDTIDLYNAKYRAVFINAAAFETDLKPEIIKRDLGKVLLKLEELQEKQINNTLEPKKKEVTISEDKRKEALEYLRSPDLLKRIANDFESSGLAGEKTNSLVGYLASISRKLPKPLAVIIQSSSSAGKSTLMEAILSFTPDEDLVRFTAMTGQSLFYMGEEDLVHKILAISEEEGAEKAQYAIKTLQSEQRLRIASTGKDVKTGRLETMEYTVNGPTQLMLTTTSVEIDEELQNRCLILTVNESKEQTAAIHLRQRELETLEGLILSKKKDSLCELHQNAQRLLRPLHVVNPYAKDLNFPTHLLRLRRDHAKYLTLIKTIALLRQYQKPIKSVKINGQKQEYIEVDQRDIKHTNYLMNEILSHSLDDLAPQTRTLLELLTKMVKEAAKEKKIEPGDVQFTRRQVREYTGWSNSRLKIHLYRLEEMEYLALIHGGPRKLSVYELLYGANENEKKAFTLKLVTPK